MKACLLYKTFKIVFLRFNFTIYDMGIQGGYKRLQGVTRGYKGLHEVSRVTGGYRGLQEVKKGYKG